MPEVQYTAEALIKTRFIISPLEVLSGSAKVYYNPGSNAQYASWIRYVHEALDGVDLPIMADFQRGAPECTPDLFAPYPISPNFHEELQFIASMPESDVEESIEFQLMMDPPEVDIRKYEKNPRLLRDRVVDEMQTYWQRVMQPHWSQMHAVLESDVMQRSRQLAAEGYEKMIAQLDERISLTGNKMVFNESRLQFSMTLDGDGLIFVPSLFNHRTKIAAEPNTWAGLAVFYPSIGAGNWRDTRSTEPSAALQLMLGEHRARLLLALNRPTTTTELAAELNMSPGAISQQLKQLHEADMVSKNRQGKRVYYRLTARGESLLNIFESGAP